MTIDEALTLLGLEDLPSDKQIRTVYREWASVLHPDKHQGKEIAGVRLRRINEARDVLLDVPKEARRRRRPSYNENASYGRRSADPRASYRQGSAGPHASDPMQQLAAFATRLAKDAVNGNRGAQVVIGSATGVVIGGLIYALTNGRR